jgi:hypothetical protein
MRGVALIDLRTSPHLVLLLKQLDEVVSFCSPSLTLTCIEHSPVGLSNIGIIGCNSMRSFCWQVDTDHSAILDLMDSLLKKSRTS